MEEQLKVSKDYKKAYNHADIICTQMPHLLDGMVPSKEESSEYTQGFNDRVRQYRIEQDVLKNMSRGELLSKYGKGLDSYGKGMGKEDR